MAELKKNLDTDSLTIDEAEVVATKFLSSNNLEIISHELKAFSSEKLGYLGDYKLLKIEAREKSDGASAKTIQFFVKTRVPNCNDFDKYVFLKESRFFREVLPSLLESYKGESWAPECYLTQSSYIVLEDLKVEGFKTGGRQLTSDQLRAAVCTTARFHASSILLQSKLGKSLKYAFPGLLKEKVLINDDELSLKWLEAGVKVAEAVAVKLGLNPACVSAAYDLALKKVLPDAESVNVLCHNDLWFHNLMFKDDDVEMRCRLVDFQMVSYTSPAIDLLQLFHLNVTEDMRTELEEELIKLYHTILQDHMRKGGLDRNTINLNGIMESVNDRRICGMVIAVQLFPFALLNEEMAAECRKDPATFDRYSFEDRVDFVFSAMKIDEGYRTRIEDCVTELINYMEKI